MLEFPETQMVGVVTDFSSQLDLGGVLENASDGLLLPGVEHR